MGDPLAPDCARCSGLCCVALPFARSADFAVDKPVGRPCLNLADDDRCRVHDRLRSTGWRGCATYDCFGAGQHVSQVLFGGVSWREDPSSAATMFAVLPVVHQLHEMLSHLREAAARPGQALTLDDLGRKVEDLTVLQPVDLLALDLPGLRREVGGRLREVSTRVRSAARPPAGGPDRGGADLLGADLRTADLRAADLRGTLLVAADLRRADLRHADLLGADLRDADVRGADLRDALFLTRPQLAAARGDGATRLPAELARPAHWVATTRP